MDASTADTLGENVFGVDDDDDAFELEDPDVAASRRSRSPLGAGAEPKAAPTPAPNAGTDAGFAPDALRREESRFESCKDISSASASLMRRMRARTSGCKIAPAICRPFSHRSTTCWWSKWSVSGFTCSSFGEITMRM